MITNKFVIELLLQHSCAKHYKVSSNGKCYSTTCLASSDEVKKINPNMKDISKGCEAYKLLIDYSRKKSRKTKN